MQGKLLEQVGKSSEERLKQQQQWKLWLTNGGLHLHTPTMSVCKKINSVEDANWILLTYKEKIMQGQEANCVGAKAAGWEREWRTSSDLHKPGISLSFNKTYYLSF